ncbi:perforin-1-like, partial [Clarias magur]
MLHRLLLILVVLAAFLPPPTSQQCVKANEFQWESVDFTPGSDLAGEGFDITTMQRKGAFVIGMSAWLQKDKTCSVCKNPYMGVCFLALRLLMWLLPCTLSCYGGIWLRLNPCLHVLLLWRPE